jgi:hypothetical protein
VATPRAVRIPRASSSTTRGTMSSPDHFPLSLPGAATEPTVDRRMNRAGSQRAFRLVLIYLVTLMVLYVGFVLLDRVGPGGTSPTAATGLLYFTAFAAALAVGGVLVALSPVPRSVEVSPTSVVVVEWWGRRRKFPPLSELRVEIVRRYPGGLLSSDAVESLEIGDGRTGRRTYQLEEGLIPLHRPPMLSSET